MIAGNRQFVNSQSTDNVYRSSSDLSPWVSPIHVFSPVGFTPEFRQPVGIGESKWVSVRAEKDSCFVHSDHQGTIHIPKLNLSIETWFFHNGQLDIPNISRPLGQRPLAFYGVNTSIAFSGGACNIVLFPISSLVERFITGSPQNATGRLIGVEHQMNGREDMALNEMKILFVIRSFSRNGSNLFRLEYKDNYLWINKIQLIFFPTSPGHCYFIDGHPEDLTEYFMHHEGNTRGISLQGNCTGLIGYSGLASELNGITYYLNFSNHARTIKGGFNSFLRSSSNLVWNERYSRQKKMIDAGEFFNELLYGTFPHLIAFGGTAGDKISSLQILSLNRWGLYDESRRLLQQAIQSATLYSIVKNKSICSLLPFLIHDYFRFSRDLDFIKECRKVLRTIGYWMVYSSGFGLKRCLRNKNAFQNEDAIWFCASLKAMSSLAVIMNLPHESSIYQEHYFHLRQQMLHRIQEVFLRADLIKRKSIREWMNLLAGIYPFNLWEKESELVKSIIRTVYEDYYQMGGMESLAESAGMNLRYTAAFGHVLLLMGLNYKPVLDYLCETARGVWNWPDIMDPVSRAGIGEWGHDPDTLFRILLTVRNLFVIEDDDILELFPGFIERDVWRVSPISLRGFPTAFGEIESNCRHIGFYTEIGLEPNFWKKPSVIRIRRNNKLSLTFCDTWVRESPGYWEFGPELRRLRFKSAQAADTIS